jgi:TonB family protein
MDIRRKWTMNETRPSQSSRRVLSIAAGLCLSALALYAFTDRVAAWHVDPVPAPPRPAPFTPLQKKAPAPEPTSEPLRCCAGITRPVPLHTPPPETTNGLVRIQGSVIIEAVIDRDGRVRDTRVLKGLPRGLDEKAVKAVRSWRFEPATRNGKPVAVFYTVVINYDIRR